MHPSLRNMLSLLGDTYLIYMISEVAKQLSISGHDIEAV